MGSMSFTLSFGGVQLSITPSSESKSCPNSFISGVRHCDGYIEAKLSNFTGKIVISEVEKQHEASTESHIIVDALMEDEATGQSWGIAGETPLPASNSAVIYDGAKDDILIREMGAPNTIVGMQHGIQQDSGEVYDPFHDNSALTIPDEGLMTNEPEKVTINVGIDSDDEEKKIQHIDESFRRTRFDLKNLEKTKPEIDLSLHEACESEYTDIYKLSAMLKAKPELAAVQDELGDYPAHVFARNDAFIFAQADCDVENFVVELYDACPEAFLTAGFSGQVPFADGIVDWVDNCHQLYKKSAKGVFRVSELKTLTKSTRVINTLCIRAEVQKYTSLPKEVILTPKVFYSFKMLSFILDHIIQNSYHSISNRREFFLASSKRKEHIIDNIATIPFIVRTILLIDNREDIYRLIKLSIVRHIVMNKNTVDLWLLALISGDERAKNCAAHYFCLVSRMTLQTLYCSDAVQWSSSDLTRFEYARSGLYDEIGRLDGFLPAMLDLGDKLYIVSTRRAVKHVVEEKIGRPYPVYLMFMDMSFLFTLMATYRIIFDLIYDNPPAEYSSLYPEFWGLSISIAVYFIFHDLAIMVSLASTSNRLWTRYLGFGNTVGMIAMISALAMLCILYIDGTVADRTYIGLVAGLMWWKLLLQMKGMSEHLATLIYTILQVSRALKYFIYVFLIVICFFADMITIVKQTTGECDGDNVSEICSSTQMQTYLLMYGVMIGGVEFESLSGSSVLVCILFVAATTHLTFGDFSGEYDKAKERSCMLFARARLESAAYHVAHERIFRPKDDQTSGIGRKIWRKFMSRVHAAIFLCVEVFLIRSVITTNSLVKQGMLSDFKYGSIIFCAVIHHLFMVAVMMYSLVREIKTNDRLKWLKNTKFHCTLAMICLKPVCYYLRSVGLNGADLKTDPLDQLQKEVAMMKEKQGEDQQKRMDHTIESAISASEQRIISAISSLAYIATQGRNQ
ncbi:hypothetical protein ACHAXS_003867 [Conticribra weissflogii]